MAATAIAAVAANVCAVCRWSFVLVSLYSKHEVRHDPGPEGSGSRPFHVYNACLKCVLELLYCCVVSGTRYYCCFRLVTKLVASHDLLKTNSGCHFRVSCTCVGNSSEKGPLFRVAADPKTVSKHGSLKHQQLWVYKSANRPCDPKTFIFGSRNGVIRDGLSSNSDRTQRKQPDRWHEQKQKQDECNESGGGT